MFTIGLGSYGQTIISRNKSKPDTSAMLEVESQDRGMLIPRMTSAQRDSILNPAEGLIIYNVDTHSLEFFDTQTWVNTQEVLNRNTPCGSLTLYHYGLEYGTVEYNGRCWLDRNIGATRVAVTDKDSLARGGYFQWGRGIDGHQLPSSDTTSVLSNNSSPGHDNFILSSSQPYDWLATPDSSLWGDSSGYLNNPCPQGWRVPTLAEWTMSSEEWMNNQTSKLAVPVTFSFIVATVFGVLAFMWFEGNPAPGVILFAAIGFGLAVILVIQWILSRLAMNLLYRIKKLEDSVSANRSN